MRELCQRLQLSRTMGRETLELWGSGGWAVGLSGLKEVGVGWKQEGVLLSD